MYGLIGSFIAQPGKRDDLIACMAAAGEMPGCRSYVIAIDPKDADKVWVTEVWDSADLHKASLSIPAVKNTIAKAMPLIAGFGEHIETVPVAGI